MGLRKQIELENGIVLNYHRINTINKVTNRSTIIEVSSYISEEKREEERKAIEEGTAMNVFIDTTYINKEYIEDEDIKDLYDYLKTTEKFKNAIDC